MHHKKAIWRHNECYKWSIIHTDRDSYEVAGAKYLDRGRVFDKKS